MKHRTKDKAHQLYVEACVDPLKTPAGALPPFDVGLHVIPLKLTQELELQANSAGDLTVIVTDIISKPLWYFQVSLDQTIVNQYYGEPHEDSASLSSEFGSYGTISFGVQVYDLGANDTRSGKFSVNVGTIRSLMEPNGIVNGFNPGESVPDVRDAPQTITMNPNKTFAMAKSTDSWHTNFTRPDDSYGTTVDRGVIPSCIVMNGLGFSSGRQFRIIMTHHIWAIPYMTSLHVHNTQPSFSNPLVGAVAGVAARKMQVSKISASDAVNFAYDHIMPLVANSSPVNPSLIKTGSQLAKPVLDYIAQYIDRRFNLKSVYKLKSNQVKKQKTKKKTK